jgi:DNA-binding LacI/PurR family transcriptional regulator
LSKENNKRLTIKDLARMAGVSTSTISRVINNNPGMSDETRTRVTQLLNETGFKPSEKARNFYKGNAGAIGLVIPRPVEYVFSNPFYLDILGGAADASSKGRMNLLIVTSEKDSCINLFQKEQVDGVIIISVQPDEFEVMKLKESNYPFVLLSRLIGNNFFDQIEIDDFEAAKKATEYLLNLGHKKIAFIGCPVKVASGYYRLEGYRQALANHGISVNENLITTSEIPLSNIGATSVKEILAKVPETTAFFAFNDLVAMGAMDALRAEGYEPGRDISVMGFDDIFAAKFTHPSLTTVRQSGYEKGKIAVERLLEIIKCKEGNESKRIFLETSLIIRNSCHQA